MFEDRAIGCPLRRGRQTNGCVIARAHQRLKWRVVCDTHAMSLSTTRMEWIYFGRVVGCRCQWGPYLCPLCIAVPIRVKTNAISKVLQIFFLLIIIEVFDHKNSNESEEFDYN